MEELGRRLRTRGTDSAEVVQQRLDKAAYELSFAPSFDMVIVNDHLEQASREAFEAVSRFIYGVGNILGAS
jgi:guanylate kinase